MALLSRYNQHSFAQIPSVNQARSSFDRSFTVKDTFNFDYLTPIYVDEVIPGDTHKVTVNSFVRLATQLVPIMDNMYVDFFFFFVPNRLVWENWERMCGAQDDPTDTTDYSCPYLTPGAAFSVGSIFDKYGLPTGVANVAVKNTLPLRAYIKIWNDWFRDQNMQNSLTLPIDDGPDVQADFALQKRGKRHDYFTSCLPWPQKGDAVQMPLGTSAPVTGIGVQNATAPTSSSNPVYETTGPLTGGYSQAQVFNPTFSNMWLDMNNPQGGGVYWPNIQANLAEAIGPTINAFRLAIMTQSLLELDARGGTRYVEVLKAHYGVISPDFRLQRSEYLGGGEMKINSHPVAQTAPTSGGAAQASLAAFSTGMAGPQQNIGFSKSFVEHGYIIGLACARADITYQQGVNRMFLREGRFDFFWPKLQELGEQAVTTAEIYAQGNTVSDAVVFGYQERYGEYRYRPSEIHGEFRSTYSTPLDMWHMAEEFGSAPQLNSTFIVQNTPIARALAVTPNNFGTSALIGDFSFSVKSARPMMMYGVPATLGRF